MAILFAGCRPWHFGGGITAGSYGGLSHNPTISLVQPATRNEFAFAPVSDFWVTFYLHNHISQPCQTSQTYLSWTSGGTELFRIWFPTASTIELQAWNGTSWVALCSWTAGYNFGAGNRIDFHVRMADLGEAQLYVANAQVATFSGDTLLTAATTIDGFRTGAYYSGGSGYAQFAIADESVLGWDIVDLYPTANGFHTTFDGDYTMIDDTATDDVDIIASTGLGSKETAVLADVPPSHRVGYDIVSFFAATRARGSGASFQSLVRSGTAEATGATISPTLEFKSRLTEFPTNPATAAAWTITDLDGVEVGVASV